MRRLRNWFARLVAILELAGRFLTHWIYRTATHPVFMVVVAIALLWGFYHALSDEDANSVQKYQLLVMGVGFTFCVIVVLWQTRTWTLRSLGILAEHFAGAVLYGAAGISEFHPIPIDYRRDLQDLARSSFFVAVMLLIVGLLSLIWSRRKRREAVVDPLDPHYENHSQ